jgi:hypothetical protein
MITAFERTDDPVVTTSPPEGQTCGACTHFSQWLTSTGDCMWWANQRNEEMFSDAPGREQKSARMTAVYEGCAGWEARTQ